MAELRYVCQLCEKRLKFAVIIHALDSHRAEFMQGIGQFFEDKSVDEGSAFNCRLCSLTFGDYDVVHIAEEHYTELNEKVLKALYAQVREDAKKE